MKKLLFSSALILCTAGAFAQEMGSKVARIGVKAGVNLSRIHYTGTNSNTLNDYTKDNVGYNFTVFGDFGVGENFFIQPGISLQNKGTKLEGQIGTTTGTAKVDVMAIEIPVNAVFRVPTGDAGAFLISAGPYASFNIDGKNKTTVTSGAGQGTTETDLKFGNETSDNLTSTDFGANFGLGYRMSNGINIGANYGLGLSNLVPKDSRAGNDSKATNRILGFSVGYSF
ncbi:MAG: PorT family protein [Sphingobacteriales bacterium]|nr:MAG: PorT family protein [Sphingobacteriales bacterium]